MTPATNQLGAEFPNPFNGSCAIRYQLPPREMGSLGMSVMSKIFWEEKGSPMGEEQLPGTHKVSCPERSRCLCLQIAGRKRFSREMSSQIVC
jgi:hypothetical protein